MIVGARWPGAWQCSCGRRSWRRSSPRGSHRKHYADRFQYWRCRGCGHREKVRPVAYDWQPDPTKPPRIVLADALSAYTS